MYEMDEKCRRCKNNGKAICNRCDMYYDEFDPIDKPPITNADRIRAMTDEEIENWYWWMHKEMMRYTDSRVFVHNWLKQEASDHA